MGFFNKLTNFFIARMRVVDVDEDIIDGQVVHLVDEDVPELVEEPVIEKKMRWRTPREYIEHMNDRGFKERTVKEYTIDINSFGINVDDLSYQDIENRLHGLQISTKRRKLTALRSFAKWRLIENESTLFMTLSTIDYKKLI